MKVKGILITRPQAQAEATAARLRQSGCQVWLAPLLDITPVPLDLGSVSPQAVLITSANAIPALAASILPRTLPVYAVGDATARQLQLAGFTSVCSAAGDARALAALVRSACIPGLGCLLHLCGEAVAGQLAAELSAAGFWVESRIVYRASAVTRLPDPVMVALQAGQIDRVLLHSPRSAAILARLAHEQAWKARVHLSCLSPAIAAAAGNGWASVSAAKSPNEESLLQSLPDCVIPV